MCFFAVSLAVVLVLLVALTRIVHSVTQPLSRLSQRMRSVDVKNDWQGFEYPYHNEIGTLSRSFNSMLAHIHMLLDEQETYIAQLQDEKRACACGAAAQAPRRAEGAAGADQSSVFCTTRWTPFAGKLNVRARRISAE